KADKKYPVSISAKPTGTSRDALFLPSKTTLTMHCGDERTSLVNLNFPVSEPFFWRRECGEVTLNIEVGRLNLAKTFEGEEPFIEFLKMFSDGKERFVPADFPLFEAKLIDSKIEYIDVNYDLSGQKAIFAIQEEMPVATPIKITSCWAAT
ncbi:MAG: hypothetical protein HQL49_09215, partial [Gammaproteobacteria bacterium]|nr:hypothetical protein [Gammaproteobacteria bacterium]